MNNNLNKNLFSYYCSSVLVVVVVIDQMIIRIVKHFYIICWFFFNYSRSTFYLFVVKVVSLHLDHHIDEGN
jgi:hypothetical protein